MAAHDDVRHLMALATDVVDRVPKRPFRGSPRHVETSSLEATAEGGASRAAMLNLLNVDMQVMLGHLSLVVGGVADALEVASRRNNEVNGPALAYVVRPALELAGQMAWLLTDQIDGERRARRYAVWRLADLRAQRLLIRDFGAPASDIKAAALELDETEADLLAAIASAKWTAQPTKVSGADVQAATLLGSDGKPERMPGLGALVREVSSAPATYGLLSITSHSQRFGVMHGLKSVAAADEGEHEAQVGGFPLPPNLLIGFAVLAINLASRLLAGWNALDAGELHRRSTELMAKAGLR